MKVYITLEYRSPWAAVNSLWAAARQNGFVPDRIHLLTPQPEGEHAQRHVAMLSELQRGLGKDPRVEAEQIQPDDLASTRKHVRDLIKARKRETAEVAVDVTPGRTIAKLAIFQACADEKPHHIFYLDVPDYDYRDLPYVRIPFRLQRSRDVLDEVVRSA